MLREHAAPRTGAQARLLGHNPGTHESTARSPRQETAAEAIAAAQREETRMGSMHNVAPTATPNAPT